MSPSSFTVLICFLSLSKASSVIYGKVGGKVVLDPGPSAKLIETITWKHGEDIAVESYGGKVFAYRHFNGCTALNMSTGVLTISALNRNHSGSYTAEINNVVAKSMEVRVLLPVPKPVVSMRCDAEHVVCTLTCKGNTTGAEPVRYSWSIFDVLSYERGPELNITKENPDPWFRCDLENDVSSASSEKINNPFKGRNHWLIIGLSVACVVLLIGIFLVWFIRKRRKEQYDVGTVEERKEMLVDPSNGGETAQQNHMSSVVPVVDNETETINESSDQDKPSKESSDEPGE
ncbi:uncharacterized protein LOC103360030 isoform X2 [Stegastes partitus]|uniref:Uncharacterized protein LOC103360030 isoform X2 n=1 Tax=Stegastes partitus TaxID=144197 RepID=A0A9Y4K789_9TELE|nr:PREDICTED: uncharacterized protein LOC103360030 isoform X2 [Stegastes partitus]